MDAIQPSSAFPLLPSRPALTGGSSTANASTPTTTASPEYSAAAPSGSAVASSFDAMVYRSQFQRTSMMMKYAEATGATDDTAAYGQQLEFNFSAESRTEQLALFSQRTTAVADGLGTTQQTQFLGVSRTMAMRFKLSVSLSGEALQSFAGAAEVMQSTGDASLDKFIQIAKKILGKDDETLKDAFKMLEKMLRGRGDKQDKQLQNLMEALAKLDGLKQGGTGAQAQSFRLDFQLEFSFESTEVQIQQASVQQGDPLVLDLDDDGIELTDYSQGAQFDLTGSGSVVRTAFVNGGDGFLAFDRNGNGRIDGGVELFGDQRGAANGYEELRRLDSNGDGVINEQDADYDKLLIFRDNGNGISEAGELMSLREAGIAELSLNYQNVNENAAGGNRVAQSGAFRRYDGTYGRAADVLLNYVA